MDEDAFRDISARNIFWTFAPNQIFCTQPNILHPNKYFADHLQFFATPIHTAVVD